MPSPPHLLQRKATCEIHSKATESALDGEAWENCHRLLFQTSHTIGFWTLVMAFGMLWSCGFMMISGYDRRLWFQSRGTE